MLTERSKVPSEAKKRYFFPAKNPVDARREVVAFLNVIIIGMLLDAIYFRNMHIATRNMHMAKNFTQYISSKSF